jgi:hypothetical protein
LQRKIRQDNVIDLGISTLTLVMNEIKVERVNEAFELTDYELAGECGITDSLTIFIVLVPLASFGEEEIEKIRRQRYYPWVKDWLFTTPDVKEFL